MKINNNDINVLSTASYFDINYDCERRWNVNMFFLKASPWVRLIMNDCKSVSVLLTSTVKAIRIVPHINSLWLGQLYTFTSIDKPLMHAAYRLIDIPLNSHRSFNAVY